MLSHLIRYYVYSDILQIKSNVKGLTRKGFYKDIQLINDRSHFLKGATEELIESFERNERKELVCMNCYHCCLNNDQLFILAL